MAAPVGHAQLKGSEVPQHATFAHSKEDVLNALSFYFGQPVSPEKLKDYNEHHAATYHFPDAYAGSNVQIRDVRTPLEHSKFTPSSCRFVCI